MKCLYKYLINHKIMYDVILSLTLAVHIIDITHIDHLSYGSSVDRFV